MGCFTRDNCVGRHVSSKFGTPSMSCFSDRAHTRGVCVSVSTGDSCVRPLPKC